MSSFLAFAAFTASAFTFGPFTAFALSFIAFAFGISLGPIGLLGRLLGAGFRRSSSWGPAVGR